MSRHQTVEVIRAEWPAPGNVGAVTTTRAGGSSFGDYRGLNLAAHVGDSPGYVRANRDELRGWLRERLGVDAEPSWLRQVHGTEVVDVSRIASDETPRADAWVCFESARICGVLTADCLPIFFCDRDGTRVGLAHAGWRGLSAGVIERTVAALDCEPSQVIAWFGPAISVHAYQVGDEVRGAFVGVEREDALAFTPDNTGAWRADLCALAANRLRRLGVRFSGGGYCTFHDAARFYSYRRNGRTGRMASLIWL